MLFFFLSISSWNWSDLMPMLWRFCTVSTRWMFMISFHAVLLNTHTQTQSRMSDAQQYFSVIYSTLFLKRKERITSPSPFTPPPAHEVHWQCTTHNEGSLHASMKFNLRCEWMTEKSCRLWFILMKLFFKTAPHGRACWAATQFLITYKLRVF